MQALVVYKQAVKVPHRSVHHPLKYLVLLTDLSHQGVVEVCAHTLFEMSIFGDDQSRTGDVTVLSLDGGGAVH